MKKSNTLVIGIVAVIIILIAIFAFTRHSSAPVTGSGAAITPAAATAAAAGNNTPTVSASVTQTATVSTTLSKYQNDELGFSVQYPTEWAVTENPAGPLFTIPLSSRSTTISTLNSSITVASGKCVFPQLPPTTIKETTTMKAGGFTYDMISVKTTAGGLNYANRMYTLQQGTTANPLCYIFSFAAVTKTTNANNQPVITAADNAFTAMVKTFAVVTGPAGESETSHSTGK